jgi:hypothetical protein
MRFRLILPTAGAVVAGAWAILFDPIFQGVALSPMAGEVASTVLSGMTVPVLYSASGSLAILTEYFHSCASGIRFQWSSVTPHLTWSSCRSNVQDVARLSEVKFWQEPQ